MNEDFLLKKLDERRAQDAFRRLQVPEGRIDFCSNDYLGIATQGLITLDTAAASGAKGSRLLSGNFTLTEDTEKDIARFHQSDAALIFNSGYDANIGLLASIASKGDTILYDKLCHASIRDGIRLSFANSFSFAHNDVDDLKVKLSRATGERFVVTESVFSMDGDLAPLAAIAELCVAFGAKLIVDEAHATGVIGEKGAGLVQALGLELKCFARMHTFGKALGCHGAVVLGSTALRDYLINFARSFIYTTALPPAAIHAIRVSYQIFPTLTSARAQLKTLIAAFPSAMDSTVQRMIIPGNEAVKKKALALQSAGFDVRPILYPTVPRGTERLRVVLHSFNTVAELESLLSIAGTP